MTLHINYNYPSPPFPQSTGTYPPPTSNNGYPSLPTSTQYQPPPGPPPPPIDNNNRNSGSYLPPPSPPPSTQPPPPYYQYQPPPGPPPPTSTTSATTSAPTSTQYQPPPGPPPPSTTTKYQPPPGPPPPLTTTKYQPPPGPPPPLTTTKYQPPPGPPPPPTSATHETPGRPPFNYQLSKCSELYSFRESDMVILTDDQTNPSNIPNRANIIKAMHWLVNGAAANDSGHGGQEKDRNGDEEDGYDESIMPVDFKRNGTIIDDDMHAIMVRPLPPGVRLTAIFDSCHSGTALDLPYVYSTRGMIKEPSIISDGGNAILTVGKSYLRGDITGIKTTLMSFGKKVVSGNKISQRNKQNKSSPADVIMFSGCKDIQTSADTNEAGQSTGAMSYAFIKTLRSNRNISYQQLLNYIRDILAEKYSQKPQLSS
nr:14064_t:CDS:2 [Entrophospora candida]